MSRDSGQKCPMTYTLLLLLLLLAAAAAAAAEVAFHGVSFSIFLSRAYARVKLRRAFSFFSIFPNLT